DPMEGGASSPVRVGTAALGCPPGRSSAAPDSHRDAGLLLAANNSSDAPPAELVPAVPPDPAWNGWDVLRLIFLTLVALLVGVFAVLLIARRWFYPHMTLGEIARVPLVVIAGQSVAYLLILAYMYVMVTR